MPPRVDFYHLQSDSVQQLRLFGCRLADKAWQLGHTVLIYTTDEQESRQLDELLWSFRDDSFVPHGLASETQQDIPAVLISHQLPVQTNRDLLINISTRLPAENETAELGCERIAEIINQDANVKQQGRSRYSYYDKNKYTLEYHEINPG